MTTKTKRRPTFSSSEVSEAFNSDVKKMPPANVHNMFETSKARLDAAGIGRNIDRSLFYSGMDSVPVYGIKRDALGKIAPNENINVTRNDHCRKMFSQKRASLDSISERDMQKLLEITYGGINTEAVARLRYYVDSADVTMGGRLRIDDAAVFFARELEYIKTVAYNILYPGAIYNRIMSIDSSAGRGPETQTFSSYDFQGNAKIIQGNANDVPLITASGKQFTSTIYSLSVGTIYTFRMILNALYANKPLDTMLVEFMRMSVEQQIDRWAILGNAQFQIPGLLSIPGASAQTASIIPSTSNTTWAQKIASGDVGLIQSDLLSGVQYIFSNTRGTQAPDVLVLPIDQYIAIFGTARSNNSDTTIGSYFMQNNPSIKEVYWSQWLNDAGSNKEAVYVMFNRSPDRIQTLIPMPYTQYAPILIPNAYQVNSETRFGGVACYYPNSVTYMVGI